MDKSYVTMEQHQCPACGKTFDTGALLLDTYLRNRFDRNTVTGNSLCSDCNKRIDDGFTILVVIKDGETGSNPYRTGELLFIKLLTLKIGYLILLCILRNRQQRK